MNNENQHLFQYCPKCGAKKFSPAGEKNYRCGECGFEFYFNPSGAVVGIVVDGDGRILTTRRACDPGAGTLDLPGGFIDFHEDAETALRRELFEELNLQIERATYFCSAPNLYRYSDVLYHTIDSFFICNASNLDELKANEEVSGYQFIAVDEIDLGEVGFQSIRSGLRLLKERVASGDVRLS